MSSQEYFDDPTLTVTRREAQHEVTRHGFTWDDFLADNEDKDEYTGAQVLAWLGY